MIGLVVINLVQYPNMVAVEVTDYENNLVKAREENIRGGVGWDNRFTEDVLDSIVVWTTIMHPDSFKRYAANARGTYEIQGDRIPGDSKGLCKIRIYEYDHITNKKEIYLRVLDDITNGCAIELWYMGSGKIEEVMVNDIQLASKPLSAVAPYRRREVASKIYKSLAPERREISGSFSERTDTLSLGRSRYCYSPNYRQEMRVPMDTPAADVVASGGNQRHRCTIL